MSEHDAVTKPAKRSLQLFSKEPPPLAAPRHGRDPSDATLAINEKTIHRSTERPILLGRKSARRMIGPGVIQDGNVIIVDVTAEPVK